MSTNRDQDATSDELAATAETRAEESPSAETGGGGGDDALDLEGLDLTVETVEERISPSETNVFDK